MANTREQIYRQCFLKREYTPGLFANMVSFIPANFAIEGKFLKIKNDKGEWVNGWQVNGVGESKTLSEVTFLRNDGQRMYDKDYRRSEQGNLGNIRG